MLYISSEGRSIVCKFCKKVKMIDIDYQRTEYLSKKDLVQLVNKHNEGDVAFGICKTCTNLEKKKEIFNAAQSTS